MLRDRLRSTTPRHPPTDPERSDSEKQNAGRLGNGGVGRAGVWRGRGKRAASGCRRVLGHDCGDRGAETIFVGLLQKPGAGETFSEKVVRYRFVPPPNIS